MTFLEKVTRFKLRNMGKMTTIFENLFDIPQKDVSITLSVIILAFTWAMALFLSFYPNLGFQSVFCNSSSSGGKFGKKNRGFGWPDETCIFFKTSFKLWYNIFPTSLFFSLVKSPQPSPCQTKFGFSNNNIFIRSFYMIVFSLPFIISSALPPTSNGILAILGLPRSDFSKVVQIIYYVFILCLPYYFLVGMLPNPILAIEVLIERTCLLFYSEPIITFSSTLFKIH